MLFFISTSVYTMVKFYNQRHRYLSKTASFKMNVIIKYAKNFQKDLLAFLGGFGCLYRDFVLPVRSPLNLLAFLSFFWLDSELLLIYGKFSVTCPSQW